MPPKPKITREQILRGALSLVRERGAAFLTAKSLAERLSCSTQPIFWHFENMDALKEAVRAGCGIIFITEDYCEKISELIDRYKNSPLPAIIPLPGASGGTGYALNAVRKNVERAIGADILFRGE